MKKKQYKVMVAVSADVRERRLILAKLACEHGFARVVSQAETIISHDLPPEGLESAYFVLCDSYNFRGASITNQKLYEMAARGLFVAVGVKSLPREYEFICEAYYPEDF